MEKKELVALMAAILHAPLGLDIDEAVRRAYAILAAVDEIAVDFK